MHGEAVEAFERQARGQGEAGPQVALPLPPVIVSTVSTSTSKLAVMHRSIMLLVKPLSLWKYNWKSFGVLIVEISSSIGVGRKRPTAHGLADVEMFGLGSPSSAKHKMVRTRRNSLLRPGFSVSQD
jgi:hypothetical protein